SAPVTQPPSRPGTQQPGMTSHPAPQLPCRSSRPEWDNAVSSRFRGRSASVTQDQSGQAPLFDPNVASIARIYDYWLGCKDNFKADREAGDLMIQQYPGIVQGVRMNRAFLGR